MADVINFTPEPVRITTPTANQWQPLRLVPEVIQYDIVDYEVIIHSWEGSLTSPFVFLGMYYGMTNEADSDWFLGPLSSPSPSNPIDKQTIDGKIIRYLRWVVLLSSWGSQSAITFTIRGLGRSREKAS